MGNEMTLTKRETAVVERLREVVVQQSKVSENYRIIEGGNGFVDAELCGLKRALRIVEDVLKG